jgi:uncharacterized membrane protein
LYFHSFFGWIWIPLLIFGAFFLFRWYWWSGGRGGYQYGYNAYEILRERFARGELSKEELEQMQLELEKVR